MDLCRLFSLLFCLSAIALLLMRLRALLRMRYNESPPAHSGAAQFMTDKRDRNDQERRALARSVVYDEVRRIAEKKKRGEPITTQDEHRLTEYLEMGMHES